MVLELLKVIQLEKILNKKKDFLFNEIRFGEPKISENITFQSF